jgi:hypothetical protein
MPPAIVALRKGIKKTFDNLGNSIDAADGAINDQFFNMAQGAAGTFGGDTRYRSKSFGLGQDNTTF